MSSYIETTLCQHQQADQFPYNHFLYLLDSLVCGTLTLICKCMILLFVCQPTTVYMPVFTNTPEACDFSMTTWIEPAVQHLKAKSIREYQRFVKILVTGAISMEDKAHPKIAPYYVLLKAVKNDKLSGSMVSVERVS